jgi:hypothetical protein
MGAALFAQDMQQGAGTPNEHKKMSIGLWGGYTTTDMTDVNDNVKNLMPLGSITKITDGYSLAADFLFEVSPHLSIGPRVEYVYPNQGKATSPVFLEYKQTLYLIPVLVGGRYAFVDNKNFNLSFGLFGGVGLGYGDSKSILAVAPSLETETKYDGSDFAGDAMLGAQFSLGHNVYLGLDLGYRMASISKMNVSSTALNTGASGGGGGGGGGGYAPSKAPVQDTSGNNLKYDFSGLIANIGVNFKF